VIRIRLEGRKFSKNSSATILISLFRTESWKMTLFKSWTASIIELVIIYFLGREKKAVGKCYYEERALGLYHHSSIIEDLMIMCI
jgi:hypothetical protein